MKTKTLLNCPHCNTKSVAFCRDAIVPYSLKQLKNGKIKIGVLIAKDVNELDNCWLECGHCHECSDNGDDKGTDELNELFDKID